MRIHRIATLGLLGAALLAGCSSARKTEGAGGTGLTCTSCHGDASRAANQAAPPVDTAGKTSSDAVGQHLAHLSAGVQCNWCHVVPSEVSSPGHNNGTVEVPFPSSPGSSSQELNPARFQGVTPAWNATALTCAVYCHGVTLSGGAVGAPKWNTPFPAGDTCGNCHGFAPLAPHPTVTAPTIDKCKQCHPDPTGTTHINGVVDVSTPHTAGYSDPAATNFHGKDGVALFVAINTGATPALDCRTCHGANLNGVGGTGAPSCTGCHQDPATFLDASVLPHLQPAFQGGVSSWQTNCTFCHGAATEPFDPATQLVKAAPPQGVGGQTLASDPHVGAHARHLNSAGTATLTNGFACATCHAVPADVGHINGTVEVAPQQPGTSNIVGSFAGGSCAATYCHGNYRNGKSAAPAWTATSGQTNCDSCHQPQATAATATDAHWIHVDPAGNGFACTVCHGTGYGDGVAGHPATAVTGTARGTHVDGKLTIVGTWKYDAVTTHTCAISCHTLPGPHAWY